MDHPPPYDYEKSPLIVSGPSTTSMPHSEHRRGSVDSYQTSDSLYSSRYGAAVELREPSHPHLSVNVGGSSMSLTEPLLPQDNSTSELLLSPSGNLYLHNGQRLAPETVRQLQDLKPHKPYFLILCTLVQVVMMAYAMYLNYQLFGEVIETQPFNPMIGPSVASLVNIGAKHTPCIIPTAYANGSLCPDMYKDAYPPVTILIDNDTIISCGDQERYCGMGGFSDTGEPDQWWRFITPIFLHTGIVHLLLNLLFQLRTGLDIERDIGSIRTFFIYMSSGIFGFIFAANYSVVTPSVGCSGSLFGLVAVLLLDLLFHWKLVRNPWCELFKLLFVIIFSLGLGVLPFFDNFSHLGGFVMGIVSGIIFLPRITFSKWDKRKKALLIILAIPVYLALFMVLLYRLYFIGVESSCNWCRYVNCLPVPAFDDWCYD